MRGLDSKVAIVTGGAGRIGRGVVARLVEEGVKVAVAAINLDAAKAVAGLYGASALGIGFDAANTGSIEAMIAGAVRHFGRLDILNNNAAFVGLGALGSDTMAVDVSFELWDITMNVNVRGYLAACKYAIPHMIAAGGGSIINMSSGSAMAGDDVRIAYGPSKGAVSTLSLYVASQHGKQGIRCNAIAPGLIADAELRAFAPKLVSLIERHNLLPRTGTPEDIVSLVAFLASDDSAFITGQIIACNGGLNSHQPHMVEAMELESPYS